MMRLSWITKQRRSIIRHSRNNKKALRAFLLDCPGRFLCEVVDGKEYVERRIKGGKESNEILKALAIVLGVFLGRWIAGKWDK